MWQHKIAPIGSVSSCLPTFIQAAVKSFQSPEQNRYSQLWYPSPWEKEVLHFSLPLSENEEVQCCCTVLVRPVTLVMKSEHLLLSIFYHGLLRLSLYS